MPGYTYIMASKLNGSIYIGVTKDLLRRVFEHKGNHEVCHTSKYNIHKLVYFEEHDQILDAIEREKQLKKWRREKKIYLIEKDNPGWVDLSNELF